MTSRLEHKTLLSDRQVLTWHGGIALRSRLSADVELRHVGLFCHLEGMTPRELAELGRADPSRLREVLIRYAQRLTKKGRLPSYVSKTFVGIKSWLRFNLTFRTPNRA